MFSGKKIQTCPCSRFPSSAIMLIYCVLVSAVDVYLVFWFLVEQKQDI